MYKKNYGKIWTNIYKIKHKLSFLEAPHYVQLVITHKCNYSCEHCGTNAGKPLKDELTTDEIKKVINEMGEMGVKKLSITGGEPLTRPDLFEILTLAKNKGMKVGFVTHGGLIEKHKEKIKKLKPYSMMISIDGLKDTHNGFRGNNAHFDNSLKAMKFFEEIKIPTRSISTLVNQKNLSELEELKKIIYKSGANHWRLNLAIPEGRAKNKEWMRLTNKQLIQLFNFIKENKKDFNIELCEGAGYLGDWDTKVKSTPFYCGCGWNTCTIMANGLVMGCPIFEDQEKHSEGNIKQTSFKEIWEKKFERFRNLKLPQECDTCKHLNACRGGCWMMRIFDAHCLKEAWEKQ